MKRVLRLSGAVYSHKRFKIRCGTRITKWLEFAEGDGFGQREAVASQEVDMAPDQRGEAGDVGVLDGRAFAPELVEHGVHVDRVPMGNDVEGEVERAELLLLPEAQRAADLAIVAVEDSAAELVAQLLAVQLGQDAPSDCLGF